MLKLTKKADYGLIALRHLAVSAPRATSSAKEIAESYNIPLPLLAKVMQRLTRTGILQSLPGTNGGYKLAREPRHISALEVIRAIDGPIILTSCFTDHRDCGHSERCTVREPLRKIHEGIIQLLDAISIADIARDDMEVPAGPAPSVREGLVQLIHA